MMTNGIRTIGRNELFRIAPSAFADQAHESRSDRFTYIPTVSMVEAIVAEGFDLIEARQGRSRIPGKAAFTKHVLTFAQRNGRINPITGSAPRVMLQNAHDGTSAYKLFAGLFRMVCSNGLIVADGAFDAISIPHVGNVRDRVIEGTFTAVEAASKAGERAAIWRGITLTDTQRNAFAVEALALRFEDAAPITAEQALRVRRTDDMGNDLWTVFNRVQENLTQGGQRYYGANGRRNRVRAVTGIDSNTSLNRALWKLAAGMVPA